MSLLILTNIRHQLLRPSRVLLTACGVSGGVALLFATGILNATLRTSIDLSAKGIGGDAALEVIAPIGDGVDRSAQRAVAQSQGVGLAIPVVRANTRLRTTDGSESVVALGVPSSFVELFSDGLGAASGQIRELRKTSMRLGPALDEPPTGAVEMETPSGYRRVGPVEPLASVPFADFNGGAFVVIRLRAAKRLFGMKGHVDAVYVKRVDGLSNATLRSRLGRALRGRAVARPPGSQAKAYRQTFDSLAQLTGLGAVGALWVALFAIFNAMSMSLLERRRDVALLSVLGASRPQLAIAFLVEAAAFGVLGALGGMALGYLVAKLLLTHTLESYPFLPLASTGKLQITSAEIARTTSASLAVAILGAAVPVRRSLKVPPVEALSLDPSYEWSHYRHDSRLAGARVGVGMLCCVVVASSVFLGVPSGSSGPAASILLALLLTGVMLVLPPIVAVCMRLAEWSLRLGLGTRGLLVMGSLARNRGRTTLTVGVLALSLSLVIGLGSALYSFESTMIRIFTDRYGPPLYVTASSYSGVTSDQPLPAEMARRIARVPGVRDAYPERYLPFDVRGRQVVVVSAPMVREARDGFSDAITNTYGASQSAIANGLADGGVVPSAYTAKLHSLKIGTRFRLPGVPPRYAPRVVGFYDDVLSIETMYMERRAYLHLSGDTSIDRVAVAPERGSTNEEVEHRLRAFLLSHHIPATVEDRASLIDNVLANVRGAFAIARALQLAALVIAGLIVAGTMLTTVRERRWEFAVCRALGMTRTRIRGGVMLEALVVGLTGAAIAVLVGLATGLLMLELMESRFLWAIEYLPSWTQILASTTVVVVAVSAVAAFPANIAGRASVVEAFADT